MTFNNGYALLIVDVQEKLLSKVQDSDLLVQNIEKLIKASQLLDIPAIVTEQYPQGLGETDLRLKELLSKKTQYFDKLSFSALKDEAIFKTIESLKASHWIVVGLEAHICVLQTAIDLINNKRPVTILRECISSRHPEHKKSALDEMCKKNIRITCLETLLFELLGHAKHPKFKEISALIR